jgi:hypothetical protein
LAASGAVRCEVHRTLGLFRTQKWFVVDFARMRRLEAQLDTIAFSSGPVDSSQATLGGLVYAIGLSAVLYPKHKDRPARKRLQRLAEHNDAAWAVTETFRAAQAADAANVMTMAGT